MSFISPLGKSDYRPSIPKFIFYPQESMTNGHSEETTEAKEDKGTLFYFNIY